MLRLAGLVLASIVISLPGFSHGENAVTRTGGEDPAATREIPSHLAADAAGVAEAGNEFGIDLFHRLATAQTYVEQNLFFSPYSIATALQMAYAGARGNTEREMGRVLRLELRQERLHPAAGAVRESLRRGSSMGGYELAVANRLWGQSGEPFEAGFIETTEKHYGASIEAADFMAEPDAIRRRINSWVEEQTARRIAELLPPGSVNAETRLVLANAVYFKGRWLTEFDPAKTSPGSFQVTAERSVEIPFMRAKMKARFAAMDSIAVLELPFAGDDLVMLLLLPRDNEVLNALGSGLSLAHLDAWSRVLRETQVDIALPRFTINYGFSLRLLLSEMGMPSAFTAQADFSGISADSELFISEAFHKAFIQVDEQGAEAAAATGTVMGVTSVGPGFIADHPFLFLIRDRVTGGILFLGRMQNPAS